MIEDLLRKNRSYRRFFENEAIELDVLKELVELTRLCPSAANLQPLKYILSNEPEKNALIFRHLAWAGYLEDWAGPAEGERPSGYIIVLGDTTIGKNFKFDAGIAAQSILLGAVERELGGCMIGSIDRAELAKALNIPGHLEIILVIALGKPREKVVLEDAGQDGDIKYWHDADDVHHVPKRLLKDIIPD